MPDLLFLAAMKTYTLGLRAKWKDYVDIYYITKEHYTLKQIINKAKDVFKGEFNEKRFRSQLAYFKDIDYSEEVIYLPGFEVSNIIVQNTLKKQSLEI